MTAIDDGKPDAGDHAEHGHADEAGDRQPEFPSLDAVDAPEVGDLEQADGRGDHHRGQRAGGQVLQQVRRRQKQHRDGERADDAGQLGAGAGGFGDRRARRAAADRKALEEAGGQVGGAETDHLLVRIDVGARPRRVAARQHAGVGEGDQGDRAAADQDRDEVGAADPRNGEGRQALRQRPEDGDAGARCRGRARRPRRWRRPPRSGCPASGGCA